MVRFRLFFLLLTKEFLNPQDYVLSLLLSLLSLEVPNFTSSSYLSYLGGRVRLRRADEAPVCLQALL